LLYFDGCPNWQVAARRLSELAAERPGLRVTHCQIRTIEQAHQVGFHGSPSIHVGGVDVFADADAGVGLACRVYETPDGIAGAPTLEQLRTAIPDA